MAYGVRRPLHIARAWAGSLMVLAWCSGIPAWAGEGYWALTGKRIEPSSERLSEMSRAPTAGANSTVPTITSGGGSQGGRAAGDWVSVMGGLLLNGRRE